MTARPIKLALLVIAALIILPTLAEARDVYVRPYFRRDGTFVRPHVRSSPDSTRANNYGPSEYYGQPSSERDADHDGIANRYDSDDNNNGIPDDADPNQYRQ